MSFRFAFELSIDADVSVNTLKSCEAASGVWICRSVLMICTEMVTKIFYLLMVF